MKAKASPEYWRQIVTKLKQDHPALYEEVRTCTFAKWDPASISNGRSLSKKLIKLFGNEHHYAESTFLGKIKAHIGYLEREARRADKADSDDDEIPNAPPPSEDDILEHIKQCPTCFASLPSVTDIDPDIVENIGKIKSAFSDLPSQTTGGELLELADTLRRSRKRGKK